MANNIAFKKLILLSVFLFVFIANAISQCQTLNLIKNPSLEEYTCCPTNGAMIDCALYWTQPLQGNSTSEYLNVCGIDSLFIPNCLPFWQHAHFGNGYAGICTFSYNGNVDPPSDYREYIQGILSEPLISGQCYYCQFWVKLFNFKISNSFSAIDDISILFSDTMPKKNSTDEMAFYLTAQINSPDGTIITDTSNWTMISDTFIAKGGEMYFTVGTFKLPNTINEILYGPPYNSEAYYFFDNFSLCPCGDTIPPKVPPNEINIPNVFTPNSDGFNDNFVICGKQISSFNIIICNRWGKKVYESTDLGLFWDGTENGQKCASGVYYFILEVRFKNGQEENKKGTVMLMR